MHTDPHGGARTPLQWLCMGVLLVLLASAQASVRAVTEPPIRPAETSPLPVQPAGLSAPAHIQPAGSSVTPPPIRPTGSPANAANAIPKLMQPDESDTDAERIRKLEAVALGNPRRGTVAERTAGRTAWLLGLLYLHGEHAPVDRVQARRWFERSKVLNEPLGNAGLAWCEIDGCNGPPSPSAARPYIAALQKANPGLAQLLEWRVQERLAPVQTASPEGDVHGQPDAQRMQLLQQAAQAGNASAINELGLLNVTASRYELALRQFNAASSRSPAAASNAKLLSMRLRQNSPEGAQRGNSPEELYEQARRYHRGDGVPSNYTEAVRLYQLAAATGSQPARRMLELIYSRPAPGGMVNIAWMRQLANMDVTAEGAILSFHSPPTPLLYVRDLTPLYEFIPQEWRKDRTRGAGQR